MRKVLLCAIVFFVMVLSVAAIRYNEFPYYDPFSGAHYNWWYGQVQDNEHYAGITSAGTGTSAVTYTASGVGNNWQPLVNDWNKDGRGETLVWDGNYMYLYDYHMVVMDSALVRAPSAPPQMLITKFGSNVVEAYPIWHNGSSIFVGKVFNNSGSYEIQLVTEFDVSQYNVNLQNNALVCAVTSTEDVCITKVLEYVDQATAAAGNAANRIAGGVIYLYKLKSSNTTTFNISIYSSGTIASLYNNTQKQLPTIGLKEFYGGVKYMQAFMFNLNSTCYASGSYASSCAGFDTWYMEAGNRGTRGVNVKNAFKGQYQADPVGEYYQNPAVYIDFDGGGSGNEEIFFMGRRCTYQTGLYAMKGANDIECYKQDGTKCTGYPANFYQVFGGFGEPSDTSMTCNSFHTSNIMKYDCDGDGYSEPVVAHCSSLLSPSSGVWNTFYGIRCFNPSGTYYTGFSKSGVTQASDCTASFATNPWYATLGNWNTDPHKDVFVGGRPFSPSNQTSFFNMTAGYIGSNNGFSIMLDINGDQVRDVLESQGGGSHLTKTYLSEGTNQKPTISLLTRNPSSINIGQNTVVTVTFSDTESDSVFLAYDCNWVASPDRDYHNCGSTPYATCITGAVSPRSFNCTYASTGTKTIKAYVNDASHSGASQSFQNWNSATVTVSVTVAQPEVNATVAYPKFQYNTNQTGEVRGVSDFSTTIGTTYSTANGMDYQPLVGDVNKDGNNEVIVFAGTYIRMFDSTLTLLDEYNLGFSPNGQPALWNDGNRTYIVFKQYTGSSPNTKTLFYKYKYGGGVFSKDCNGTSNALSTVPSPSYLMLSGITCKGNYCMWFDSDGSDLRWAEHKADVRTCVMTAYSYVDGVPANCGRTSDAPFRRDGGAIFDIDRDGKDEIVERCWTDKYYVFHIFQNATKPLQQTTITLGGDTAGNPMVWNIDGSGDIEVYDVFKNSTGYVSTQILSPSGANFGSSPFKWNVQAYDLNIGQPVMLKTGFSLNKLVCGAINRTGGAGVYIKCFKSDGTSPFTYSNGNVTDYSQLIAADMNNDGYEELVTTFGILGPNYGSPLRVSYNLIGYHLAVADVNSDGKLEILGSKAGSTKVIKSSSTNSMPTVTSLTSSDYEVFVLGNATMTTAFQDPDSDNVAVAIDCDWTASHDVQNCYSSPYYSCVNNVNTTQTHVCVFNVPEVYTVRSCVNDAAHGGYSTAFSSWNCRAINITVSSATPWFFNSYIYFQDYAGGSLSGASYKFFDVPTQGATWQNHSVSTSSFATIDFPSEAYLYCFNVTKSGYNNYIDCEKNVSPNFFDISYGNIFVDYITLKRLPVNQYYNTYYLLGWSDDFTYYDIPEHNGWFIDVTAFNSGYITEVLDSLYGRMMKFVTDEFVGSIYHRLYTTSSKNLFAGTVVLKKYVTSQADSNELMILIDDANFNQLIALHGITADTPPSETGTVQYWHPASMEWVTVATVSPNIPWNFRIITNTTTFDLYIDDDATGNFVKVASNIPLAGSGAPYYIELIPTYSGNDMNDIYIDSLFAGDYNANAQGGGSFGGSDYTVPSADVCNQFYYDPVSAEWKYDSSRCTALVAGHSGMWNMFSNLFRWGVANLGQWVLTNVFYFILLLLLFILLMPVILKWRESSGNNRR